MVLNSVTLKQSEDFKTGIESVEIARAAVLKDRKTELSQPHEEEDEEGEGEKRRGYKRSSDMTAVEQTSEISAGSSITNHVYPLLNSSEVRVSRKTEESGSQTRLTMLPPSGPNSRSLKRKFIKLTRAKSKA